MDGDQQAAFDADCKRRAATLHYRAWDGDVFIDIRESDYRYAIARGLPHSAPT